MRALMPVIGEVQAALPSCCSQARQAAAAFVAFLALPAVRQSLTLHCPPISPAEQVSPACAAALARRGAAKHRELDCVPLPAPAQTKGVDLLVPP